MKSNQGAYNVKQEDVKLINECQSLMKMGEHDAAEKRYVTVLERSPTCVPNLLNYAILCDLQGRHELSDQLFERALQVDDEDAYVHYFFGLTLLSRGIWVKGFNHYRWRFFRKVTSTLHHTFPMPFWEGEDLKGRHLLVWTEQGLGDEILLSSFFPALLSRGVKLSVVCSESIAPTFARSFPGVDIFHKEIILTEPREFPTVDYQASLSELGKFLLPSKVDEEPWFKVDEAMVTYFKKKYTKTNKIVVGISWYSSNPLASEEKSFPLRLWAPMFNNPDITFVSLQYGDVTKQVDETGFPIVVDPEVNALTDITTLAQQIKACDLVITVSNTTAHLAGALGVPVICLVPLGTGRLWYWFRSCTASIFYKSMQILRRCEHTNVDMALICYKLREFVNKGSL